MAGLDDPTDVGTTVWAAGVCRSCGRDLVQVVGERTYHPASALGPDDTCPELLPIPGAASGTLSFNVPDSAFVAGRG